MMSLALCPQVESQAPQHFRSSEKQAACEGCFASQRGTVSTRHRLCLLSRRPKPFCSHADRGAPTGAFALRTKSGVRRHSGVGGRCDRARSGITARQIGLWGVPFPPPSLVNVLIEWWRGVIRLAVFTRGSARTSKKKPPAARGMLSSVEKK